MDGGHSWTASNNGLPYPIYRYVAFSPDFPDDRTLFTAFSDVYRSRDGGATWSPLGTLIWGRYVTSLEISADGQFLYAATDGEGLFCMQLDDD
mgnify:CR=1 FL=1